jgi:hypothetical protein
MSIFARLYKIALHTLLFFALLLSIDRAEATYYHVCRADGACGHSDDFIIELNDPRKIAEANGIISGHVSDRVHVSGRIVKNAISYNAPWKFYLDPSTIKFFTFANTTCGRNLSTQDVNEHLDEIGSPNFLSTGYWCPLKYKLIGEMKR